LNSSDEKLVTYVSNLLEKIGATGRGKSSVTKLGGTREARKRFERVPVEGLGRSEGAGGRFGIGRVVRWRRGRGRGRRRGGHGGEVTGVRTHTGRAHG